MTPFVWLDLETTGLNPTACEIIQLGIIVTDEHLDERGRFEMTARCSGGESERWDREARDMHTKTGLLEKARCSDWLWAEIRVLARHFLSTHLGKTKGVLAGSSVHFDRSFLDENAPELLRFVGHRHLDTSLFKVLGEAYGWELPKGEAAHTALADLERSIGLLQWASVRFGFGVGP